MTGANLQGSAISLGAAVTLTGAAIRLPGLLSVGYPATYTAPVNMRSAAQFALLGGSTLTTTGLCFVRGNVGESAHQEAWNHRRAWALFLFHVDCRFLPWGRGTIPGG